MRQVWMPVYITESAISAFKENNVDVLDPADPPAWMCFALRRHLDSEYGPPSYKVSARAALIAALSATIPD